VISVAFLRAVNVGGRGIVRMTDLQAAFTKAGCVDVTTFIASGNVIFEAPAAGRDALRSRVAAHVERVLGAEPVIVYRTLRELTQLVERAPFGAMSADATVKLYVAFVTARARRTPAYPLHLPKEGLDAIGQTPRGDVLLVSRRKPNGMYGFPNNWIENELGVRSTARSWSTVTKIVATSGQVK
jgi:uncharacterized protein (DUF1697 family)